MKEIKPGYKETSIGVLPNDWEVKSLGEISDNIGYGMNSPSKQYDGKNKYIRITDISEKNNKFIPNPLCSPDGILEDKYLLEKNDILFARTGASTGKTYIYNIEDGDLYFAGFLIRFNIFLENNSNYIFYNTKTNRYKNWLKVMSVRSGQPGINAEEYKEFEFPIPPKEEQEKIVQILMTWDEAIEKQEELIELEKEFKKGMMQKIFNQKLRFKDENGNDYPEWEEKALGEIGEIVTGKTPSTDNESLWNGEIQFITPTDIKNSKYQLNSNRTVKENPRVRILPEKSIMYTCIASIGKMALSIFPCITNQQINTLIPKKQDNEYIYYALLKITPQIMATQSSTTLPIINKSEFSKFKIPLPSLPEQEKIANFLSTIDEKIEVLEKKLEELKEQKKGLMQKLLTGEVRV